MIITIGKASNKINAIKTRVMQQDTTKERNIVNAKKPMGNSYNVASSYVDTNHIAAFRNTLRLRMPANDMAKKMRVKAIPIRVGQEIFF